ncbi:hypothetical protein [Bradyrhizobium cenepequi]|uniref:hypothetical protein n=1 Tax=Bradyrhizobium cenepequi TaxID=2821403 RepID=UPI001CE24878|nr:hypothetical protein [Bradyrhizobium cenepequi]MCA6111055.1 hypothetical protein [Bradyrhizobium cenepequi]
MMTRLMVSLTVAAVVLHAGHALAQGAFPAPLPGQQAAAPANASPFPPVNGGVPSASIGTPSAFPSQGAAPIAGGGGAFAPPRPPQSAGAGAGPQDACMKGFIPLREETERRGKLIKIAGEKKAGPDEACKLIGNYSQAELKMMKYVKENSAKCGIPPQILDQLQNGHKNTEAMQKKVCAVAQQIQNRPPAGPTLSEVLGSASAPEAVPTRKGGSTFDTLNGNVLAR